MPIEKSRSWERLFYLVRPKRGSVCLTARVVTLRLDLKEAADKAIFYPIPVDPADLEIVFFFRPSIYFNP